MLETSANFVSFLDVVEAASPTDRPRVLALEDMLTLFTSHSLRVTDLYSLAISPRNKSLPLLSETSAQ